MATIDLESWEKPRNLKELRIALDRLWQGRTPTVPKTWLKGTTWADINYLRDNLGYSSPIELYLLARGIQQQFSSPLETARDSIASIVDRVSLTRFAWLFFVVCRTHPYKRAIKDPPTAVYPSGCGTLDDVGTLLDTLRHAEKLLVGNRVPLEDETESKSSSSTYPEFDTTSFYGGFDGTPLGRVGQLLQLKYPHFANDLEEVLEKLRRERSPAKPKWVPGKPADYAPPEKLALLAMKDLLSLSDNRASIVIYNLFDSAGLKLGDPANPIATNAAKALRVRMIEWKNKRKEWISEAAEL